MEDVKRILVVSRRTRCCRKALRYGISLAQKYGAELFVVHVVHNPFGLQGWNISIVSLEEEYRRDLEKAKKELDRMIEEERRGGMTIQELIREGEPTKEVIQIVESEKIDLIVMVAHEEGRLEHFLFGRSNEEIARRMPCSILLVKEKLSAVWF